MSGHVLVVDDEPDMRLLLRLALGGSGFELTEAATGEEALDAVEQAAFDVVLLDLNLPGINGMDVLRRWHEEGTVPDLAVVMLTADAREELAAQAAELGARDYISKPVAPADLIARVQAAIEGAGGAPGSVGA